MITPVEAANRVKETQKYEWIIKVKDYDNAHYVVEALPKVGEFPIGVQGTFGVDKETGEVTAFMLNYGNNLERYKRAKECKF